MYYALAIHAHCSVHSTELLGNKYSEVCTHQGTECHGLPACHLSNPSLLPQLCHLFKHEGCMPMT